MFRLNKKVIAVKQFLRSIHTTGVSASWLHGIRDRISRFIRIPERHVTPALPNDSQASRTTRPVPPPRFIIFSDTDNDLKSVNATLRFAGILGQESGANENTEGVTIFHTGDLIDKNNPDLSVVQYWQLMQQLALKKECHVRLIAGNHEQEIWQRIHAGEDYGMARDQAQRLKRFIESMDLFYVAGPILFIHGYPTLEFVAALAHFKEVTGKNLNSFNKDHYKKSFISVRAMKQYAYVRENRKKSHLLYDIKNAENYYKKNGRLVGRLLKQLNIHIVVHGHKPQRSGTQADYEFEKWIPNIRMVGNDTNVSRKGIGATVIGSTSPRDFDIVFINSKTATDKLRSRVQEILGKPCELNEKDYCLKHGDHPQADPMRRDSYSPKKAWPTQPR